jgi:hypothetical protein
MIRRIVSLATLAALVLAAAARLGAISVSPLMLVIDARTRTGTLTLYNDNPLPEEIEISFGFGYPVSDSTGKVRVELADTAPTGEPSAVTWMRAFPRRLLLQPGQRQVVRIIVQPPAGLPDGEYWGRVLVTATGGRPPIEQEIRPDVRVAVAVKTVFAPAVLFRKGNVSTGVTVSGARAQNTPQGARLVLDLERQGNAAFLGRITAELQAPDGRVMAADSDVVAVYHRLRRDLVLTPPAGASLAGARVRYTVDTERPDAGDAVLEARPVSGTVQVD